LNKDTTTITIRQKQPCAGSLQTHTLGRWEEIIAISPAAKHLPPIFELVRQGAKRLEVTIKGPGSYQEVKLTVTVKTAEDETE